VRPTLTKKIGLLLLLPFIGSLVGSLVFEAYLKRARASDHVVNAAGREEILAAELRDWAHMVSLGQEEDRAGLRPRVKEFEYTLVALQRGGLDLGNIIAAAPPDVKPELAAVASLWNGLRPDLLTVSEAPRAEARFVAAYQRVDHGLPQLSDVAERFAIAVVEKREREQGEMLWTLRLIAVGTFAVFFAGLALTRRFIVRPIAGLDTAARRMRAGDFSLRLDASARDELGMLARTFNAMAEQVERLLGETRLQAAALHAAADAIVITDANGAIEWVNPAFVASTGFTAAEAMGKNPRELVKSGKHDQAFYKDLWDTIRAGRVWRGKVVNRRKDGSLHTVEQSITPVLNESGAITHYIAIKEDISESLLLQAQLLQSQKIESVGRLAGGVAHDFNNLLSVIIGWTGIALQDLPAGHAVRPSLEEVLSAGERAAGLTRQLLAFSRQQVMEPTLFNVNDLVVQMDTMLRRLIGENIEFVTRTNPELGTVKMDRGQLEQVLLNLVVNARDAMPEGGKLTIETANVVLDAEYPRKNVGVTPGEYVMLAVTDSGTGMSEEVKTHIFEPFFTTKAPGKGTGLGLATCYGIAKQAGGHIAVYSEEGLGTAVRVYLPRSHEVAAGAVGLRRKTPARGVETILLVEDDPVVRRVIARMVEAHGYRVVSTSSGEEALRVIEDGREPWQLLLTDVILADGMSGPELAERVRALRPDAKVLFASGYTSDVTILHGLLEEGVAFVQKPFTAESLTSKMRQVLDAK
jgi:PAS domain S-box-containing protein